ncbi:RING/U-box superfamily protein [Tanacetum coccineum]
MGNKLGRKRCVVDEKHTKPQGLYQHKDVDHKKLRKLILDSKLAPCYPGGDDCRCDLEECPILLSKSKSFKMLHERHLYRMLFADETLINSTSQCPFCKTFNYAVEYRGVKTKEEKGLEQIEEQRVIDAKIRMRRKEIQDEEERMQKRQEMSSSSRIIEPNEIGYASGTGQESISIQQLGGSSISNPSGSRQNRDDEFDLENIMLMEAIWLSFQEDANRQRHQNYGDAAQLARYAAELHVSAAIAPQAESTSSASPSGGLAYTIASLAEHQVGVESSTNNMSMPMYNTSYNDSSRVDEMNVVAGNIVPESYEDQMMLAMAVSLSEARARTTSPEITWQ